MKHQDSAETAVLGAFGDVDALHDLMSFGIDDLPRISQDIVVGVDAARCHDLCRRCRRSGSRSFHALK